MFSFAAGDRSEAQQILAVVVLLERLGELVDLGFYGRRFLPHHDDSRTIASFKKSNALLEKSKHRARAASPIFRPTNSSVPDR